MEGQTGKRRDRKMRGGTGRQTEGQTVVGKQTDGGRKDRRKVRQTNKMKGRKKKG